MIIIHRIAGNANGADDNTLFIFNENASGEGDEAAGIVALLIALLTVSFPPIKAALSNPAITRRTE